MFKIKKDVFHVTRGDKGEFDFSLDGYVFKIGDKVSFRVYNAGKLQEYPVLNHEVEVLEDTEKIQFNIDKTETKIGELVNDIVDYWYEIELNGESTPFCYDEKGPKIFKLYPEGADTK